MEYEVVVVGGGIGGLTVAALLAARGVSVCLFERQSQTGGCVANFEFQGYTFEPTSGLYAGWEPEGIQERIFSELPVQPPEVRRVAPAYAVRLPDHTDVQVSCPHEKFAENVRAAFPECADAAVSVYCKLDQVAETWLAETHQPDRFAANASRLLDLGDHPAPTHFTYSSTRFPAFIHSQLQ